MSSEEISRYVVDRASAVLAAHAVDDDCNTAREFREALSQRDAGEGSEGDHGTMQ